MSSLFRSRLRPSTRWSSLGAWVAACLLALPLPSPAGGKDAAKDIAKDASKDSKVEAAALPESKEAPADKPLKGPLSMEDLRQKLAEKVAEASARAERKAPAGKSSSSSTRAKQAAAKPEPGHVHELHWDYAGDGGPDRWAQLKPEFATCASGKRQSPIDIRGGIQVDLEPIRFNYQPVPFTVVDNGHTVQVNVEAGNFIEVNGRRYDLRQFHFHRPSEERINGQQFEMVAHLVHRDAEGRLAVVALLIEPGRRHPLVQQVWNSLPLEKNDSLRGPTPMDLNALLPEDRRYYTYMGSLTTPPCSEGVLWLVLKQPVGVAADQIGVFARLYPMNARPLQPDSGRLIKASN